MELLDHSTRLQVQDLKNASQLFERVRRVFNPSESVCGVQGRDAMEGVNDLQQAPLLHHAGVDHRRR